MSADEKKGGPYVEVAEECELAFDVPHDTAMLIRHIQDSPDKCHLDLWVNNSVGGHDRDHIIHNVVMMLLERPRTQWPLGALKQVAMILRERFAELQPPNEQRPS